MRKAPDFALKDQDGFERTLEEYKGRWLVLFFYPKDDTPGCTTEACSFRDAREVIAELGDVIVLGISKDSVASHKKFANKYSLRYTLLSDPTAATIKTYNAWGRKKFLGKEYDGILRNTYIISADGYIAKTYENVDPNSHVKEILDDLTALKQAA